MRRRVRSLWWVALIALLLVGFASARPAFAVPGLLAVGFDDYTLYDVSTSTPVATNPRFTQSKLNMIDYASNGVLYGVDGAGDLFKIDKVTAQGTLLGTIPGNVDLSAMAFDGLGVLHIVDPFTGAATLVGTVAPLANGIGGLTFEPMVESAGVLKKFTNTTARTADGVDIVLIGVYSNLTARFDGLPAHKFTGFSLIPGG